MTPEDCLFCKIAQGIIPSEKIYEDAQTFAFLDINPINVGHTLVIPKHHAENIMTIKKEDLAAVMETVRKLAPVIQRAVSADGINIGINNGSAAGQVIFHAHVHVMPRFDGDGHEHWQGKKLTAEEIASAAIAIRKEL
jgi:histidine triad (HIT) family protein